MSLERFYTDAAPELQARGVLVVLRSEEQEESVYDTFHPRERPRSLWALFFGIGLLFGIYGREVWEMLA